jgi:hypothetical protein
MPLNLDLAIRLEDAVFESEKMRAVANIPQFPFRVRAFTTGHTRERPERQLRSLPQLILAHQLHKLRTGIRLSEFERRFVSEDTS